ncbi:MAG: PilX N-terminal domain-containing pilus assembly protein, partial [Gammaproteobacteria bacterium]
MHTKTANRQRGAALITALIFLVIITMLSLTAMRSSMMELRQASNDETRVAAFESAMAVLDAVLDTPASMPVVGEVGDRSCSG